MCSFELAILTCPQSNVDRYLQTHACP